MTIENQEIDLMKLLSKFFNSIGVGIKKLMVYIFSTIKKYKYIYLIFGVLFVVLGSLKYYNRTKTNSIRAYFETSKKEVVKSLVQTINFNIQNGNYNYLISQTSINREILEKISSIEVKIEEFKVEPKQEIAEGKLIEIPQPSLMLFYFDVKIKKQFDYNILKQGLSYFFNINEYLNKEVQLNLEKLVKTRDALMDQLRQIIDYQKKILNNPNIKSIEIVNNNKIELANDKTMEEKVLALNDKIFNIDQEIARNHDAIRFINNFSANKTEGLLVSLVKLFFILIGLSFSISVFIDFVKWLNKETKKI